MNIEAEIETGIAIRESMYLKVFLKWSTNDKNNTLKIKWKWDGDIITDYTKVKKSKKQLHTNKLDNLHERAKFLKKRQITKSDSRIGRK